MECIDALAEGINNFSGGLLLVSHDFRLISQVAKEISFLFVVTLFIEAISFYLSFLDHFFPFDNKQVWLCDNKTVKPFKGDITAYKKQVAEQLHLPKKYLSMFFPPPSPSFSPSFLLPSSSFLLLSLSPLSSLTSSFVSGCYFFLDSDR